MKRVLLLAGRGVEGAGAGGVAEVDAVAEPARVGAVDAHADDDLRQQDAARQDARPSSDARAVEQQPLVADALGRTHPTRRRA